MTTSILSRTLSGRETFNQEEPILSDSAPQGEDVSFSRYILLSHSRAQSFLSELPGDQGDSRDEYTWDERGRRVKASELKRGKNYHSTVEKVSSKKAESKKLIKSANKLDVGKDFASRKRLDPALGVDPRDPLLERYTSAKTFTCLGFDKRKVQISHTWVNDNYCDCVDGSDEPGTAACSGRLDQQHQTAEQRTFFCRHEQTHIFASRVNDGICDCCDGSDEWGVFESPAANKCPNSCRAIDKARQVREQQLQLGAQLRREYIQEAAAAGLGWSEQYGTGNAFYHLTHRVHGCFSHDADHYRYTLCLFESVTQKMGK
eukprot:CAMPEP_0175173240 /NCGR_PEP_ID=MMETSP0087-20121206/31927_1 /TAXON_ID=136419 /ORGANISM="Unknown Unknown, Strain D1" /LENGTH=316 /DNA_ID=CAMNT_0016464497 /DNA_START=161 /DNA_END=1110 /DNA_ORIENTATION=+